MKLNVLRSTAKKCFSVFKSKRDVLAVEINSIHGIGAKLVWVLEILAYCEENNLKPRFKFSYPYSNGDDNYFDMFFEIENSADDNNDFIKISSIGELNLEKNYNDILNIELAEQLIKKYLIINEDVVQEVDGFCAKHFGVKKVLGIHYRGTDKSQEAPYVPYDKVERNINYYLDKFPQTDLIFLSSDDENFIKYIENCSFGRPIIYRKDSFRSADNAAIHHSSQNKYDINRDAIINALILSRCDALMKTSSILSAWSKLLNSNLPLIMLNKPFDGCNWFPERDLFDNVLYDPVP